MNAVQFEPHGGPDAFETPHTRDLIEIREGAGNAAFVPDSER